jgi:ABC-type branched-subunit amino acid transport system permease subunit
MSDRGAPFLLGAGGTPFLLAAVLALVLVAGPWLPQWAMFILTIAFATGLVALGLILLLRAGLVSFGQALYYCLGAYSAGALGRFFGVSDILLEMLTGAVVAALFALALGFLLARYRGIFFGLLSLALSMILYGLLVKNEALGSTDGFNVLPSTLFGLRPGAQWVRYAVMACGAVVSTLAALAVHRYLETPLGRLAPAIKDNEIRVEYMGASARHAVHVKYVIAAALAGIGGALAATTVGHIDPEMAYWTTSGEFIFIAILAGTRSVLAPFAAALLYGAIRTTAYDLSPNTWQMTLGIALLLLIVFLPEGLWSIFRRPRWR